MNGNEHPIDRRSWLAALGFGALLGFFLAMLPMIGSAHAQQPSRPSGLNQLLAFFYQDPRPERLVGIFVSMQQQARSWNAYPPLAGLLAGVFSLHPDWIERLTPAAPDSRAASTLAAALRISGQSARAEALRARLPNSGFDAQLDTEFADLPTRLADLRIKTPTHLDILWGASFANGEARYVTPIIDFMAETANVSEPVAIDVAKIAISFGAGPKDVLAGLKEKYGEARARQMIYAAVALWAIRSNSIQHPFVKRTVADYIGNHPGTPATKALSVLTGIK